MYLQHHHYNVSLCYGAKHTLGQLVDHQCSALKTGTFTPDQVARLNRLGFRATHGPVETPQVSAARNGSEKA